MLSHMAVQHMQWLSVWWYFTTAQWHLSGIPSACLQSPNDARSCIHLWSLPMHTSRNNLLGSKLPRALHASRRAAWLAGTMHFTGANVHDMDTIVLPPPPTPADSHIYTSIPRHLQSRCFHPHHTWGHSAILHLCQWYGKCKPTTQNGIHSHIIHSICIPLVWFSKRWHLGTLTPIHQWK